MSISSAAAASAGSSIFSLHPHNHKKGVHLDSITAPDTSASGQAPATTQGLFSSLMKTIEQVAGLSPLGSVAGAAGHYEGRLVSSLQPLIQHVQSGAATTPAASGGAQSNASLSALGSTVNTTV